MKELQMSIASMKLVKCKADLVTAQLAKLGLPTDGTLRQVVERLVDYYEKNEGELDLADCTTCGGGSDAELTECPFCGTGGPVDSPNNVVETDPGQDEDPDNGVAGEDDDPEPEEGEGEEGEEAVGSAKKKATKAVKAPAKKASKPAAKEVKAPKAPKAKGGKVAAPDVAHEAEIVDGASPHALVSTVELDEQIKVIRTCAVEGGVMLWKLGMAANRISEGGLWKLRCGPDGVPLYKSFKQFCTDEIGATPQHIYRAMDTAKHLTEDQVRGLSVKQIRVVMQLPAGSSEREELLQDAKQGKGTKHITEKADQLRGKPTKVKPEESPEIKKQVTIAVVQGHHKLKMYKRPNTGGARVGDTTDAVRAKKLADAPWAVMDFTNDVRMLVRVGLSPKGEVSCDIEFRRGKSVI
jgi:hypothetical protein